MLQILESKGHPAGVAVLFYQSTFFVENPNTRDFLQNVKNVIQVSES